MTSDLGIQYQDMTRFERRIESAQLDKLIADALVELDAFLHSVFVSGDEPKWSHQVQRDRLLSLRKAMIPLGAHLGVLDPDELARLDVIRSGARAK